jgi:trigger factor
LNTKHARIPGFRPGKAPPAVVRKRFEKEIAADFKQAVVSKAYRDGLKETGVEVVNIVDVPEVPVLAGAPVEIAITIEVQPKFDLPEYTGIPVKPTDTAVKDEEVETAVEGMRRERAEFKTVERAAAASDYVKFGFEGRIGDQKIADLVTDRPIYGTMPSTWEEAGAEEGLLPGVGKQLIGLAANESKDVEVTFPEKFPVEALAGKTATYAVSVQEVRERVLPAIDEAFLKLQGAESVDQLREQIRKSLTMRKEAEDHAERRRQVADALSSRAQFPIPESLIDGESDSILRQLIEQNMRRGVPQEELEKSKEELYATARKAAIERTKIRMLLTRVAEAEKIKIERDDINRAIYREAQRSNQKPEKIAKDLEKDRDRVAVLQQNILVDKALDFLVAKATVRTATAKA